MRFSIIIIALSLSLIVACKKDKLKGDREILIGKWKWLYTDKYTNTCNPPDSYYLLTPSTENINYSIEFIERGKVVYYENEKKTSKDRVVFHVFEFIDYVPWQGFYHFVIYGDNKNDDVKRYLSGYIKNDTLIIRSDGARWPHYITNTDCQDVYSYFIRE